ncbi:hypothetical protein H8959_003952 [Pygathrix nigripes]
MRESGVEAPGSSRDLHPSSARKYPKVGSQEWEARPFLGSSARWPRPRLTPGPPPGHLGGPSSQQRFFRSSLGPLGAHPPGSPNRTRRGGGEKTEVQVPIAAAGAALFAGRPQLPARSASAPLGPAPRPGPGSTNRRLRPPPPHLRGGARAPPPPSQRPLPAPPLPRRPEITRLRRLAPHRRGAEAAIWRWTPAPQSRGSRGNGEVRGRGARQTPRPRASGRPERAASPGEAEAATAAALGRPLRSAPCPVWCCRCSLAGHFRNYSDTETEGEIFNSLVQYFGDNLGRKVKAMPLVEETSLLEDSSVTFPVVIIGNGPSGICLSYMLSGYRPYLSSEAIHPNTILNSKLEEARHLSIVDQDLEYLSEGLEGRSSNPVAVLFDTLLHPDADFGYDYPSVLHWKLEQHHYIPHLVLGKGPPGGAWHNMEGSMLTISFGSWMELPGLKFKDWVSSKRRNLKGDRVMPEEIARYYKHYVKVMGLQKNFRENTYITSVSRLYRDQDDDDSQDRDISTKIEKSNFIKRNWEIRGYQRIADGSHVPFCLFAENVALATGTLDSPAHLEIEGEDFPFVFHSMPEFGAAINKGKLRGKVDPVLIVGSGLTAADAVLCAYNSNIPVIHVFRRRVTDPSLIFKQLPKKLYPEYHKVYHMMCTQSYSVDSNLLSDYTSFPEHHVLSFKSDMKCVLQSISGLKKIFKLSAAVVLIGSHPNLSFLKDQGCYLGHKSSQPITCKGNPVEIDTFTYECIKEANLFALGPLVGDNFVRFLKGGALGVTRCLATRQKKKQHLFVERGGGDGIA